MARALRGDVVWADLSPVVGHEQAGRRPVVVLSADVFNERSGTVIAMALTGQAQRAGFPLTLELKSLRRVKQPVWAKISQVRTLSTRRLGRKLGRIGPDELDRLVEGLNEIIAT
jgi:mRNA interferase MazF